MRGAYRWLIFIGITALMVLNFLDRVVMSFAVVPLSRQLHLTPAQIGLVLSAFFWGLVPASLLAGYLADRWGPKRVWSWGATWWSLFTVGTAVASSLAGLIAARILFGIGEGPTLSNGIRVARDWAAPQERGRATGLAFLGVFLAPAIGAPIITALIHWGGWRAPFYVLGVLGLLWVVWWQRRFHNRPEDSPYVTPEELAWIRQESPLAAPSAGSSGSATPSVVATLWAGFAFGYALYFLLTWMPEYLVLAHHLSLRALGWFAGIPWLGAMAGQYLGGHLSDSVFRRTGRWRVARGYLTAGFLILVGVCLYVGVTVQTVGAAIAFLTLAATANACAAPIVETALLDQVPNRSGTWGGVLQVAFTLPGVFAPILTGILVANTHSFVGSFVLAAAVLVSGGVVAGLGMRLPQGSEGVGSAVSAVSPH
ncbi:MAG: MFS transporter [Firmicutes bacterium]|nr:MFS transporter [Bacillota bacterium]